MTTAVSGRVKMEAFKGLLNQIKDFIDLGTADVEASQARSCGTCKWRDITFSEDEYHPCDDCSRSKFYSDNWEAKDETTKR